MTTNRSSIAVPVDFGPASIQALHLAEQLAGPLDADIVLVHVCQPPMVSYPEVSPMMVSGLYKDLLAAGKRALDGLSAKMGGKRTLLREGDAGVEIVRAAEELRPVMIVMGTHGRKGLRHLLVGSVAEHVMRHSPVPVLTVHAPEGAEGAGV
jgi:nucleotide-binding universal stress UspA family protein